MVEQVAFEGGGEAKTVEAASAAIREEPSRALEAERLALAAQHESLLADPGVRPVLQHDGHGPDLTRRLRFRVGEVPLLGQLELERAARLLRADMHERVSRLLD